MMEMDFANAIICARLSDAVNNKVILWVLHQPTNYKYFLKSETGFWPMALQVQTSLIWVCPQVTRPSYGTKQHLKKSRRYTKAVSKRDQIFF